MPLSQPSHSRYDSGNIPATWKIAVGLFALTILIFIWKGWQDYALLKQTRDALAHQRVEQTAMLLEHYIDDLQQRLRLFIADEAKTINSLIDNPDPDSPAYRQLSKKLDSYFPQRFTFTISDKSGQPYFEDFDGFIDQVCKTAIRDFARHDTHSQIRIHPNPFAFHFDMMEPVTANNQTRGIFFISHKLDVLRDILSASRLPSSRLMLILPGNKKLIEISDQGIRDNYPNDSALMSEADYQSAIASRQIEGSRWKLLAIPDKAALQQQWAPIRNHTIITLLVILVIESILLYFYHQLTVAYRKLQEKTTLSPLHYQQLFEYNKAIEIIFDPDSLQIIDVNEAACEYYGYSHDLMRQLSLRQLHVVDEKEIRKEMETARRQGRKFCYFQHHLANGEIRDVEVHFGPIELAGQCLTYTIVHDITQRKQIENALRDSEARLRAFTRSMPDRGFIMDCDGRILEIYGNNSDPEFFADEEIRNRRVTEILPAHVARQILDNIRRTLETGETCQIDYSLKLPSGEKYIEGTATPLEGYRDDRPVVSWISRDITERHLAEANKHLTSVIFESGLAMVIADADSRILRVNRAFTQLTGFSEEESIGQNPGLFSSSQCDPEVYDHICQTLREKGVWSGNIIRSKKNGEDFLCHEFVTMVRNDTGEATHVVATLQDITEQERTAQEHERERQLLGTVLDSISDGIVACDSQGILTLFNRAATKMHGLPEKAIPPEQWADYYDLYQADGKTPMDRQDIPLFIALNQGQVSNAELVIKPKDGKPRTLLVDGKAMWDSARNRIGAVVSLHDITEQKQAEKQIRQMAYYDSLTDLPNRRLLLDRLEQSLAYSSRHDFYGALLFIDLDNFKNINDTLGHSFGDHLLQDVAERLLHCVRKEDTVARLGGDEFIIMLPQITNNRNIIIELTHKIADKILTTLTRPFELDGHLLHVSGSIGITLFPEQGKTSQEILKQADVAMYRSKSSGKNTFRFYHDSMQAALKERLSMEKHLHQAIASEAFHIMIQPQVNEHGRLVAGEVLIRWQSEELGFVSPARFIPLAEEIGIIHRIGHWVLTQSCQLLHDWQKENLISDDFHLSVNISPREFNRNEFLSELQTILHETRTSARHLMLELTENMFISDVDATYDKMIDLKSLGIDFSLDDFGTGYSSLMYLKRLPLDQLKIDQSFVRDIHTNISDAMIVETIIAMSRHLNLEVIAEGVETEQELTFLQNKGCQLFQGYYFSKPVPIDDFRKLLLSETKGNRVLSHGS